MTAQQRRRITFATPGEALDDAEAIVAADGAGTLRRCGAWTAGQSLGHIAAWIDYAFDGYPFTVDPADAAASRARLGVVLASGLKPGVRLPGATWGTFGIDDLPAPEALARLRAAWARLVRAEPTRAHAFFGELTHPQWIALNLRHAELHQSHLLP